MPVPTIPIFGVKVGLDQAAGGCVGAVLGCLPGMIYGRNHVGHKIEQAPAPPPPPPVVEQDRSKIVNPGVEKDKEKVPTLTEFADIQKLAKDGNVCICRCWRSKKFPFCDGTHNQYNKETGDNIA